VTFVVCQELLGKNLVGFEQGCMLEGDDASGISAAVALAKEVDVAVVFVGLTAKSSPDNSGTPPTFATGDAYEDEGHDRTQITLQGQQERLIQEVLAANPRTVVVLIHGGALAIEQTKATVPAILDAHYPGQLGGDAIWRTLLNLEGAAPAGRLTTTAYKADFVDHQAMNDMALTNITYKHYTGSVNWPFGYGLSYSNFEVTWLSSSSRTAHTSTIRREHAAYFSSRARGDITWASPASYSAVVKNIGSRTSDYVLLAFVSNAQRRISDPQEPIRELFDFARVSLAPGASSTVHLSVPASVLSHVDSHGNEYLSAGEYTIEVGGTRLGDGESAVLTGKLSVLGSDELLFSLPASGAAR